MLVRYVATDRAIADPTLLYKLHWLPVGLVSRGITSTEVYHRDGRTFVEQQDPWYTVWRRTTERLEAAHPHIKGNRAAVFELPYKEVVAHAEVALRESPISITRSVFDGAKLWQTRSEEKLHVAGDWRPTYAAFDVKSLRQPHFSSTVLDYMLYSFPIPGLPEDNRHRQKTYLPHLLNKYHPDAQLPTITYRGRECVSIEAEDKSSYLLDPAHDLAVVSGTWRTETGAVVVTFDAEDLQHLGDGVWLPRVITHRRFGVPEEGAGALTGKLLLERSTRILQAERNLPEHLKYFAVEVPAGAIVADETLVDKQLAATLSTSPQGRPTLTYIMPADKADLDRTIAMARRELIETASEAGALDRWRWWIIGIHVCVVVIALKFLWHKKSWRRDAKG